MNKYSGYKYRHIDRRFIDLKQFNGSVIKRRNSDIRIFMSMKSRSKLKNFFGKSERCMVAEFRYPQVIGKCFKFGRNTFAIMSFIEQNKMNAAFKYEICSI